MGETHEVARLVPDDHLRARAVHLVTDPLAVEYLNDIFPPAAEERKKRENGKQVMIPNIWNTLAKDFFNSREWRPANVSTDPRLTGLCPSLPPSLPYTGSQLRTLFNTLRTRYSLSQHHYEEFVGTTGSETEFRADDAVILYMHVVFTSMPTLPCMRDMKLPQAALTPRPSSKTRTDVPLVVDLSRNTAIEEEPKSAELASYQRDLAMEEYYKAATGLIRLQARHREVEFLQNQLKTTSLPDHTRRAMETKLQSQLDALLTN